MSSKQYLINFTSLVKWDVLKLVAVAEEGGRVQLEQIRNRIDTYSKENQSVTPPVPSPTSRVISDLSASGVAPLSTPVNEMTTASNLPHPKLLGNSFLEQHSPEAAKCAVSMAMTLIAAIEFIGSLLDTPDI